jgi:hypothetical protein
MFDETVLPDVRNCFEDILSQYSVFMAQGGTPTVSDFFYFVFLICFSMFSMVNH